MNRHFAKLVWRINKKNSNIYSCYYFVNVVKSPSHVLFRWCLFLLSGWKTSTHLLLGNSGARRTWLFYKKITAKSDLRLLLREDPIYVMSDPPRTDTTLSQTYGRYGYGKEVFFLGIAVGRYFPLQVRHNGSQQLILHQWSTLWQACPIGFRYLRVLIKYFLKIGNITIFC